MKNQVLFISDLHLTREKPEITQRFLHFLRDRAGYAQALYILGDLFDVWVGDDDNTHPYPRIKQALKALVASGTPVFLLQGNRDFLLGKRFATETAVTLLDEYSVIELNGQRILLTHGDLLCTDDLAYQAFRQKSHTQEWQQQVLAKPLLLRLLAAKWYRFRSFYHKRKKTMEIMDVNQQTVQDEMQKHQCFILIHGHTHRPARHDFSLAENPAIRFVLPEWKKETAQCLCWRSEAWVFETIY